MTLTLNADVDPITKDIAVREIMRENINRF